jgi:acetoin utilization deacetylase AcuC-like enzyme
VFPSQKYRMVRERLLAGKFAELKDFIQPQPAIDEDLLLVDEPGWITRLHEGTLGGAELAMLSLLEKDSGHVSASSRRINFSGALGASDDTSVLTLSIHQYQNYPQFKPPSDLPTSRPSSE